MRSRALTYLTRLTGAVSISTIMIIGHAGCDSAPPPTAPNQVNPDLEKATKSMADFEKERAAKK
jgi:hypothetical protein